MVRRHCIFAVVTAIMLSALAGCADSDGRQTLTWYVNPDGQDTINEIAQQCSTDDYNISVELLPTGATDQRTQLARRLAAKDSSTNLMSLDPVYIAEFANAGWLAPLEGAIADKVRGDDVLAGAAEAVQWNGKVVAAPQWANTQVLWYRKSLAEAADVDMSKPVTWDQVITAAAQEKATVGVQANRYEAYVVWINSLIQGAGGNILDPATVEDGRDAKVTIDSPAGKAAAEVISNLADSGATQPDFTTSNEGTSLGSMFPGDGPGSFMVNWTFVYKNYADLIGQTGGPKDEAEFEDLGWARYPRTLADQPSRAPVGGINVGVGAYSKDLDAAREAASCVTSSQAQEALAVNEGLMPSSKSVYESDALRETYPPSLLDLYAESIDEGGPRPKSAFYSQISNAVQARWHPPTKVDPDTTPKRSADFLTAVLTGEALL